MLENSSYEEQISFLKYSSGISKQFLHGSFIAGCACLAFSAYVHDLFPAMLSLLPFALCYHGYRSSPMIKSALRAWKNAKIIKKGTVTIVTETFDNTTSYSGSVSFDSNTWACDFLPPVKWSPTDKIYVAQLYFIEGCLWPSLIATDEGILCPSARPQKVK